MIPRIIHQKTHDKRWTLSHPHLGKNIERLHALNPGWDYRLYDDDDAMSFIRACYGAAMARRFERIDPVYGAARADLFRYLLMYEQGGVYLDLKSTALRPLDEMLRADETYVLSHWRNGLLGSHRGWGKHRRCGPRGEFQQWHIIAAPRHPFLERVIARVAANIDAYPPDGPTGRIGVLTTTGPVPYTLAITSLLPIAAYRLVDAEDLGLRYNILDNSKNGSHKELQPPARVHYSVLTAPIVRHANGVDGNAAATTDSRPSKYRRALSILAKSRHKDGGRVG